MFLSVINSVHIIVGAFSETQAWNSEGSVEVVFFGLTRALIEPRHAERISIIKTIRSWQSAAALMWGGGPQWSTTVHSW